MQSALRRTAFNTVTAAVRSHALGSSAVFAQAARAFATSTRVADEAPKKSGGILQSLLHGSEKAKAETPLTEEEVATTAGQHHGKGQHSQMVGRGKYIHEVSKHKVKPGNVNEYKKLVGEYYENLAKNPEVDIKLTGSWEVVVGELDTFFHIWEHSGFNGLDHVLPQLANSKEYQDFAARLAPLLDTRTTQLVQEFSFWPSSPPKQLGGLYEMRTYTLKPGTLLEWEQEWRVGLDARKQFVQPIAAFFSQIGELHQVIHMWHYDSLETRKQMRQRAWEIDTWSNTVAKTVKLTNHMSAQILQPLPFSPLR